MEPNLAPPSLNREDGAKIRVSTSCHARDITVSGEQTYPLLYLTTVAVGVPVLREVELLAAEVAGAWRCWGMGPLE